MKICLVTDQHFGARSDNLAFHEYFSKFYMNVFFPYLEMHDIDTVVDLGDTFDRRKYINFDSLRRCRAYWFDQLQMRGIKLHCLVGNHDTYFKNTNDVNSPDLLLGDYDNIVVYDKAVDINLGGCDIAMLPWICSGNYKESIEFIENTRSQVLFGHLELAGFEMYRGSVNDHGFSKDLFKRFDLVCSGHFHHKSSEGDIHYLGAPYEMSWSDYNDPRGFHIFDTETRELEYVQNPYCMFNKIHYDDSDTTMDELLDIDMSQYKDTYVKVIVRSKNNPFWFDLFIEKLERNGVVDLQVVDDHFNLNLEDDSDIIEDAEDTLTILRKVVEGIETSVPKKDLDTFLTSLYNEALYAE